VKYAKYARACVYMVYAHTRACTCMCLCELWMNAAVYFTHFGWTFPGAVCISTDACMHLIACAAAAAAILNR